MCCKRLAGNTGCRNDGKNCQLRTITLICRAISSPLRHISTIGKTTCYTTISSARPYNGANFGPVMAEIGSGVWSTPVNFNRFHVLASLLQRRCSPEANQTFHNVWPSAWLVHYIYIFGGSRPDGILPSAKFTLCPKSCILLYWQRYCTALQQQASAKLCGIIQGMKLRNFLRGRHLYLAGWPSRWASTHILVNFCFSLSSLHKMNHLFVYFRMIVLR